MIISSTNLNVLGALHMYKPLERNEFISPIEEQFLEFMATGVPLLYKLAYDSDTKEVTIINEIDVLDLIISLDLLSWLDIHPSDFNTKDLREWYRKVHTFTEDLYIDELIKAWERFAYYNPYKSNNNDGLILYGRELDKLVLNKELIAEIMQSLLTKKEFKNLLLTDNIVVSDYL